METQQNISKKRKNRKGRKQRDYIKRQLKRKLIAEGKAYLPCSSGQLIKEGTPPRPSLDERIEVLTKLPCNKCTYMKCHCVVFKPPGGLEKSPRKEIIKTKTLSTNEKIEMYFNSMTKQ